MPSVGAAGCETAGPGGYRDLDRKSRLPEWQVRLAEEFAERMLRTLHEAALALMVSVGHRTRLFDVMAGMPWPRTAAPFTTPP
jgi:hypothetical protein